MIKSEVNVQLPEFYKCLKLGTKMKAWNTLYNCEYKIIF